MTGKIMCANEIRPCTSSEEHPWDNTYMRSLKKMESSYMGARIAFENIQDRGYWYPVTLDGYIEY